MNYNQMLHCIVRGFSKGIKWNNFESIGVYEPYYEWFYAEDRLYVIRDRINHSYRFIKAESPLEAIKVIRGEADAVVGEW